ncbi:MAG TPA: hypothetical protein VF043_12105 [Ktedonobacteraceae bacterium]
MGMYYQPSPFLNHKRLRQRGRDTRTRPAQEETCSFSMAFAPQTIVAGTVYTGRDGVQVATDQTITIAAANLPYVGQETVSATAVHPGATDNIQAGDISITTATLQVRNSQLSGGDARDFTFVTTGDIQQETHALTPLLLQSEQSALGGQLQPGETLTAPLHGVGVYQSMSLRLEPLWLASQDLPRSSFFKNSPAYKRSVSPAYQITSSFLPTRRTFT